MNKDRANIFLHFFINHQLLQVSCHALIQLLCFWAVQLLLGLAWDKALRGAKGLKITRPELYDIIFETF